MINKRTKENWEKLKLKIRIGDIIYGVVFKVVPYGIYVDINEDFYGIVLAPNIGRENIILEDFPKIGEKLKLRVIDFSDFRKEYTYISFKVVPLDGASM